ncbi:hypothetical protein [Yoonia sp. SS1-5]|uniref:Uncharacterized protein n=1 Tax=Yoonia rhodophyticola TaxID=3137370 RepID=A0AAN0MC99_9RHOB
MGKNANIYNKINMMFVIERKFNPLSQHHPPYPTGILLDPVLRCQGSLWGVAQDAKGNNQHAFRNVTPQ